MGQVSGLRSDPGVEPKIERSFDSRAVRARATVPAATGRAAAPRIRGARRASTPRRRTRVGRVGIRAGATSPGGLKCRAV